MRIGIIGASSQVGSAVAYYLKKKSSAEVICFNRSVYSDVFFELLDITYSKVDLDNQQDLKSKLKNLDAIIDFTYPAGEIFYISKILKKNLNAIISSLPANAVYIYMSSIMAYGTGPNEKYIKSHKFPRSSYAYIKRRAEKLSSELGKKYKVRCYNFRIGQVHGFLQSVNFSFREKLKDKAAVYIDGTPEEVTNTVFISSIGDAILQFVSSSIRVGTYTLVSQPQWTLKQLYGYYKEYYSFPVELLFSGNEKKLGTTIPFFSRALGKFKKIRPLLETYVLLHTEKITTKLKGEYRVRQVQQITSSSIKMEFIDYNLLGIPDGKIVTGFDSGYAHIYEVEKEMEEEYNKTILIARQS